jgi:hypothetical protein
VRLLPFGHSRSFTIRRPYTKPMLRRRSTVQPIRQQKVLELVKL